ncbi:tetratricopeptide repeat protein [Aneurinibacillus soli]|uniref:Outer membrane protein assembly factor BamD n=1 Tax=Aneurinibacillus soli TaxID=1500254 RepID=A0A0U4WCH1_9BACL|nr:tetratricopeptide repeat protein [Aneurinibacillus soli]PYE61522.1 tetratricopeptide repeat protein [Aneurinibacillus soli]BAU26523.1 Outer membrane protein assembly factor BamD [Aneurinibacillus soli]
MEKKFSGRMRNILVSLLLALGIVAIIITSVLGSKQDETYKQGAGAFKDIQEKFAQRDYASAQKELEQLIASYPNSYLVQWQYGISLAGQQKYQEAAEWYEKARKQRPFLVRNQQYVLQYGEVLYHVQDYKRATRYLKEVEKLNQHPQFTEQAHVLLADIAEKEAKQ